MAVADGLKDFVRTLIDGFSPVEEDDPFKDMASDGYVDGNVVTQPIEALYPTAKQNKFETRATNSKVAVMPSAYKAGEVAVIEPRSFSEAAQIIKKLLDSKTVILNLDLLDGLQSQRTIDFVSGAAHALNGGSQKISDKVFIFTPSSIALSVENAVSQNKFAESLWNKPL